MTRKRGFRNKYKVPYVCRYTVYEIKFALCSDGYFCVKEKVASFTEKHETKVPKNYVKGQADFYI